MPGPGAPAMPGRDCPLCARLAAFREEWRRQEPTWFNSPVPSFGPRTARLLIVGLAPGLQGANRTGRPFTGDHAGGLLYDTLGRFGFSRGAYAADPDDGLELVDARITNAVRCLPPLNKPIGSEIAMCRQFLAATIAEMEQLRAIIVLGRIAHDSMIAALGQRQRSPSAMVPCIRSGSYGSSTATIARATTPTPACSRRTCFTPCLRPRAFISTCRRRGRVARSTRLEPGDDLFGILVRRKHWVEHLGHDAVVDDQRHPLQQRHAGDRKSRQLDRAREFEVDVGQNRERQLEPLGGLALEAGVLRREPVKVGDAEPLELGEMVAERARLRQPRAPGIASQPAGRRLPGTPVRG
jgi:uracil-DNA glycosylase family 4